jgi:hypothetical protein
MRSQGDQIRRIFTYWAVFLAWAGFILGAEVAEIFGQLFFHGTSFVLSLTKNWLC